MRISDWSSDVCSSDLPPAEPVDHRRQVHEAAGHRNVGDVHRPSLVRPIDRHPAQQVRVDPVPRRRLRGVWPPVRSEEHTSELQSLMRISYAVFCLKKKKQKNKTITSATTYKQDTRDERHTEVSTK